MNKKCEYCNKEFEYKEPKFCSAKCRNKSFYSNAPVGKDTPNASVETIINAPVEKEKNPDKYYRPNGHHISCTCALCGIQIKN